MVIMLLQSMMTMMTNAGLIHFSAVNQTASMDEQVLVELYIAGEESEGIRADSCICHSSGFIKMAFISVRSERLAKIPAILWLTMMIVGRSEATALWRMSTNVTLITTTARVDKTQMFGLEVAAVVEAPVLRLRRPAENQRMVTIEQMWAERTGSILTSLAEDTKCPH
jgi:hypothetical protein